MSSSSTSSEVDFLSSDNEDEKPVIIREFSSIKLPKLLNQDAQIFDSTHPPVDVDTLTEQQLVNRLMWSAQINDKLTMTLKSLQSSLQAEWSAKEQVLEKILEKEIGGDWRMP